MDPGTTIAASTDDPLQLVSETSRVDALVEVHGASDIGRVRARNEDQFLIAQLGRTIQIVRTSLPLADQFSSLTRPAWLFVVADGIGGHAGGDLASSVATDAVASYVFEMMPWFFRLEPAREEDLVRELERALARSQDRVQEVAGHKGLGDANIGTTLTMAYVLWPDAVVVHVGDSRCYLARDETLYRLTHDHTLAAQLAATDAGLTEPAVESFRHVLVNAVGGGTAELAPEVRRLRLQQDDALLLCTDGLHGAVTEEQILAAIGRRHPAERCCERLVSLANDTGGRDNVTVVLARF